ncbi:uncharacterized protein LOC143023180 [Oratosquilla oratoria]|uniref:uncharacterized protein LOC143023180 n=1 Tax=Oratosquilla oratoria TaxID=337810 RepID=UPI003F762C02
MSFIQKLVYRSAVQSSLSVYRKCCGNTAKVLSIQTTHKPFPLLSRRKYSERKVIFGTRVSENGVNDALEIDLEEKMLKHTQLKEDNNEIDSSLLPSERRERVNDLLVGKMNGSSSAYEVFALLNQHLEIMTEQHFLSAAHKLSHLVAEGIEDPDELQNDKNFLLLCTKLLKVSRRLEVSEVVNLLKFLTRLKVDMESRLMQTVLQLIRHHLNDMEAVHLVHTHFILMKMPETPLGLALQMALPIVFDTKSDVEKKSMLQELQLRELAQFLGMCIKGNSRSTGQVLQAIYEKGTVSSPIMMMSLLWSLLTRCKTDSYNIRLMVEEKLLREILIKECLEGLATKLDQLSIGQIETTLSKLLSLYEEGDRSVYNEHFFEAVVNQVLITRSSFSRICFIALKLLKMNFMPEELLHYIVDYTIRNPQNVSTSQIPVMPLINGLACCKKQPTGLEEALSVLLQHKQVKDFKTNWKKPWIRLAVDLMCLGFYHEQLVATIFDPEFKITSNHINKVQLLRLHQALKAFNCIELIGNEELLMEAHQIQKDLLPHSSDVNIILHKILHDTKLYVSGVISKQYLYIDHLLAIDSHGIPLPIEKRDPEEQNVNIENLVIPETATLIAIQEVSPRWTLGPENTMKAHIRLEHEMLEKEGLKVVPLLMIVLESLSPDESIYFIQNQLSAKGVNIV